MSWTDRSDASPCCPNGPGAVDDAESVVRLLHDAIDQPITNRFRRVGELIPPSPKKEAICNDCGDQHGGSVFRRDGLSDDEIRLRAVAFATVGRTIVRHSRGAIVATAAALRAIRVEDMPNRQVVFVYDDPKDTNRQHAVIRVDEELRSDFIDIYQMIMRAFSTRVSEAA